MHAAYRRQRMLGNINETEPTQNHVVTQERIQISSTKPHEETLSIDFLFVTLRVAWWMIS
jgi:hypothetical protein